MKPKRQRQSRKSVTLLLVVATIVLFFVTWSFRSEIKLFDYLLIFSTSAVSGVKTGQYAQNLQPPPTPESEGNKSVATLVEFLNKQMLSPSLRQGNQILSVDSNITAQAESNSTELYTNRNSSSNPQKPFTYCRDPKLALCFMNATELAAYQLKAKKKKLHSSHSSPSPPLVPDPEDDDYGNELWKKPSTSTYGYRKGVLTQTFLDRIRQRRQEIILTRRGDQKKVEASARRFGTAEKVAELKLNLINPMSHRGNGFYNKATRKELKDPYDSMQASEEWLSWVERAHKNGTLMWTRMTVLGATKRISARDPFLGQQRQQGRARDSKKGETLAQLEKVKAEMFVGIFSSPMHISRRQACRETWLNSDPVFNREVVYRFFVGLHRNETISAELFAEREKYGDLEILPFMDSYYVISYKTIAIADFAVRNVETNFIMKTDDDSMVLFSPVLTSLRATNRTYGILYGALVLRSTAVRYRLSKWFVSYSEWPSRYYPVWAHGVGYVITADIAKFIVQERVAGSLKVFKLEDVGLAMWVNKLKHKGADIWYLNDKTIVFDGCQHNYTMAHYQTPPKMRCLQKKLDLGLGPKCCKVGEY